MSKTNPNDQYEFFKYIKLTEDGRLLVEAGGVINDTYVIAGSVDVINSELVLNRNDGQEVRIDAAEFLSDAFVVSGVYNPATQTITFTNNLGGTFDVTGFELNTTASNGLTEIGNDVQLGGTLTKPTIVDKDGNPFVVNGDGAIYLNSQNDEIQISASNDLSLTGDDQVEINTQNQIRLSNDNPDDTQKGAVYVADYSLNWDGTTPDAMLSTKGYVDRAVTGGVTASNGLTEVGTDIQLGGDLTKDTQITLNDNSISQIGTGNESILFDNVDEFLVNNAVNVEFNFGTQFTVGNGFGAISLESTNQLNLESDSFSLFNDNGGETAIDAAFTRWNGEVFIMTLTDDFELEANSFTYTDAGNVPLNSRGMYYASDYSTDWDATTLDSILATKGYVDREIANATPDTIYTADGSLTGDRILDTDGNDLLFTDSVNNITLIDYSEGGGERVVNLGGKLDGSDAAFLTRVYGDTRVWLNNGTGESIRLDPNSLDLNSVSQVRIFSQNLVDISSNTDIIIGNDNPDDTQKGAVYESDYSLNWDGTTPDSMLTTKGYVDRLVQDGVTASNGLTEVGSDIQLGGTLTQDTNIQSNTELFTITADNGTDNAQIYIKSDDGVALYANSPTANSTIEMGPGNLDIDISNIINLNTINGGNLNIDQVRSSLASPDNNKGIAIDDIRTSLVGGDILEFLSLSGDDNLKGARYPIDYTTNWDGSTPDNMIPTKGYIDREIVNATPDTLYTADGSLTGDRVVDTDGNDFKITNSVDGQTILDYTEFKADKVLVLGGENGTDSNKINNVNIKADNFIGINVGPGTSGDQIRLSDGQISMFDVSIGLSADVDLNLQSDEEIIIRNNNTDLTQRGARYDNDYSLNWDDTTEDRIIPTKGYVDRKSLYMLSLGRNGNLNPNAYLRSSGNVVANASRGELIAMDSKIEGITWRVNNAVGTGSYGLAIRVMNSSGTLLQENVLTLNGIAFVGELNLDPGFLGWDGLVDAGNMVSIQFRDTGGRTSLNNVQATLKMSIQ